MTEVGQFILEQTVTVSGPDLIMSLLTDGSKASSGGIPLGIDHIWVFLLSSNFNSVVIFDETEFEETNIGTHLIGVDESEENTILSPKKDRSSAT